MPKTGAIGLIWGKRDGRSRGLARATSVLAAVGLVAAGLVPAMMPTASAATGAYIEINAGTGTTSNLIPTNVLTRNLTGSLTYPSVAVNFTAAITADDSAVEGPSATAVCMNQSSTPVGSCAGQGWWGGASNALATAYTPTEVNETYGLGPVWIPFSTVPGKDSLCDDTVLPRNQSLAAGQTVNCGEVATITFTFTPAVTDGTFHIANLGGNAQSEVGSLPNVTNYQLSTWSTYRILTGQSLQLVSDQGNFKVDDSIITTDVPVTSLTTNATGVGSGSVKVLGTYSSVTFAVGMYMHNPDVIATPVLNTFYSGTGCPSSGSCFDRVAEGLAYQWTTPNSPSRLYDYSWTTPYQTPITKSLTEANSPGLVYTTTPVTPPSNGGVVINANGTYTYTPNNGFFGTDSFVYEACDTATPTPNCGTRTVTITVPAPIPPVSVTAVSDFYTTPMNTPMTTGDAAARDYAEGTTLAGATWRPLDQPAHGTVTGWDNATGRFTYTPDRDWYGTDSFRYIVCLASPYDGTCSIATEHITVPPTISAVDDYYSTPMNTPMTAGDARAADTSVVPGGIAGSTVTQTSQPAHGTVTWNPANDGTFTYTPDTDWSGTDSFTYRICLPSPYEDVCDEATEYITVAPPITAVDDYYSTPLNTPMTRGDAKAGDSSPAGLTGATLTQTSQPAHGTVTGWDPATGRFTYTPDRNWAGTDSFTYRICLAAPNEDVCAEATEYITVGPATVTAVDDYYTTALNTPMTRGNAKAGDSSPAGLKGATLTRTSQPQHGRVTGWDPATGRFTYIPDTNWSGTDSFTYRICLAAPNEDVCDSATEYITVSPTPPSVTAVDDYYTTPYDTPMTQGNAKAGDSSPAGLKGATLTQTSQPAHGTVSGWDPATGRFTYTPDPGWSGTDSFTYRICLAAPNQDVCAEATEYITVKPPKPGAKPVTPPLDEDFGLDPASTTYTFDPMASFIPSKGAKARPSTLELARTGSSKWGSSVRVPGQGTFTVKDGKVRFVAEAGFAGTVTVSYRAQDSSGQWAQSTLTVQVAWSHPVAAPLRKDLGVAQVTDPHVFKALAAFTPSSGADAITSSLQIAPRDSGDWGRKVTVKGKGTFTVQDDGTVIYAGPACFVGKVTVDYRAQDTTGQWADSTLTVKVRPLEGKDICRT